MTNILMSIKPKYAHAILEGKKKVEYRRIVPKGNDEYGVVYVYSSLPDGKVIGEFGYDSIVSLPVDELWDKTKDVGYIEKADFDRYFNGKKDGHAFNVTCAVHYSEPKSLKDFGLSRPPQSWCYINEPKDA